MNIIKSFLFLILLVSNISCRDSEYLIFEEPAPEIEGDAGLYSFDQYLGSTMVDIIFVVDNSGSMGGIQENVAKNAELFMRQFALSSFLDWKIGIVSTDKNERPYLGFAKPFGSSLLIENNPDSFDSLVNDFSTSITKLGTNGDYSEYIFHNVDRAIDEWSIVNGRKSFLRSKAHLVVVMITDEDEQSLEIDKEDYIVQNFLNKLTDKLDASKILRFYGAFDFADLADCRTSNFAKYAGSPFEQIINLTKGFVISACVNDFGVELARIGEDIKTLVNIPRLPLRNRPVVNTIKITYKGQELKAGRPELGGVWYYDYGTNSINFYSIDFMQNIEKDQIFIDFEVDDGIDRE
jgi:hypothetical protein